MRLDISVTGDEDGVAVPSLYRWLTADQDLKGCVISLGDDEPVANTMGPGLDLISVVLGNGIALGSLAISVANWRESRARLPEVRLVRGGTTVEVRDGTPQQVQRMLEALGEADDSASDREV
ncbi:hypothetical protein [Kitasatospora sp. NPDC090091]|uniref:effector-associated constant component EACC1 n=1 Tax=Kitasatospora sp. NPDC090091 TaxID=3364081 RepID=UPI0037FDE537